MYFLTLQRKNGAYYLKLKLGLWEAPCTYIVLAGVAVPDTGVLGGVVALAKVAYKAVSAVPGVQIGKPNCLN